MNKSVYKEVNIQIGKTNLPGELFVPYKAKGIIVFSHGSGSSRLSKRNQQVAAFLHKANFGTLLFDLLTTAEDSQIANRFNIDFLTERLVGATKWLEKFPESNNYRIGYFGASTGAACALQAAAELSQVGSIVSRGGRPDLASINDLRNVTAPVLLIVGSLDTNVLELNKMAFKNLKCYKELVVIEGASHLFEEKGTLDEVARMALAWFEKHLKPISLPEVIG